MAQVFGYTHVQSIQFSALVPTLAYLPIMSHVVSALFVAYSTMLHCDKVEMSSKT